MDRTFDKIAIIGAGTMGCQLAALFAGAGCRVELLSFTGALDCAQALRKRLAGFKPPALFAGGDTERIRAGSLSEHAGRMADCGWIVESVIEDPGAKREVFSAVEAEAAPGAIVSSNTSSISYELLASGMGAALRPRFLITHFFNPPRYLKLVEICSCPLSEDAAADAERFLSKRLGKGVVRVKDTPGFVANRIGVYSVMDAMHMAAERGWPVEAVDTVMGRPAARPRQGVFRMLDMVGLDTVAAVAQNIFERCAGDELSAPFSVPAFLSDMLGRGWRGTKSGYGFYSNAAGSPHALDLGKVSYRPRLNFCPGSLVGIDSLSDPRERLARTAFSDDQAGEIAWPALSRTLVYAASRAEEIAGDIASVDRALRWGFGWELGPFEAWDALGVRRVAERLESEGRAVPSLVERLLSSGRGHFYSPDEGARLVFDVRGCGAAALDEERPASLSRARRSGGVVESSPSASLIDLGDGVYCCEFHTKMNALDEAAIRMITLSVERAERSAMALLIANEGEAFSAGADLKLIGALAERGDFRELDRLIRMFQAACQRVRFSARPVVAVPFGRVLGGGLEICLAAAGRVAHAESYAGLAELMVGLVPAGGGCKQTLLAMERREAASREGWVMPEGFLRDGGPYPRSRAAFELIGTARVSSSARDAVGLGYFTGEDCIVMDRDLLIARARDEALMLARGYEPPCYRDDILLSGRGGQAALMQIARHYRARGLATDYDLVVVERLARILSGGGHPVTHSASEDDILDMEREAFLSLAGEERTQDRIAHMLKTRKPLRN